MAMAPPPGAAGGCADLAEGLSPSSACRSEGEEAGSVPTSRRKTIRNR